eukprot:gene11213-7785_t
MTQATLRRTTAVYALVLMVLNFFLYLYAYRGAVLYYQYALYKEMLMRVSYVSAMVEWATLEEWLENTDALAGVSEGTPLSVSVQKVGDNTAMEVKTIAMTSVYPITVYKYSPKLNGVIEVTEGEVTPAGTGVYQDMLAVAMGFILMIPFVLFGTLAVSNLVARRGRLAVSKLCMLVGYLVMPMLLSFGLLALEAAHLESSTHHSWQEDVRRSGLLYSSMFAAARTVSSSTSAKEFAATLENVNTNIVEDQSYQVVLAIGEEQAVAPPLYSDAVHKALFTDARDDHVTFIGFTDNRFYAGLPVPSIRSLLVVVRESEPKTHVFDIQYRPVLLLGVCTTGVCAVLALLVFLPLKALGQRTAAGHHAAATSTPWSHRLSAYWPYMKLAEMAGLLGLVVLVAALAVARLALHYQRTLVLQEYHYNRIDTMRNLQAASNLLASAYTGIMRGDGWNTEFLAYSTVPLTEVQEIYVSQFYKRLSTLLSSDKYFAYSCGQLLVKERESTWPILSNAVVVRNFFLSAAASMAVEFFHHWVLREDIAFMIAVLSDDATFLQSGNAEVSTGVQDSAAALGDADLLQGVTEALAGINVAMTPFLAVVEAYHNNDITMTTFQELYETNLGAVVVGIEQDVIVDRFNAVPANQYLCLTYAWDAFNTLLVLMGCSLLICLYAAFDAYYTCAFFGDLSITWLLQQDPEAEPETFEIETLDYTSPRSTTKINAHSVRRSMWQLCVYYCFTMAMTVLLCGVLYHSLKTSVVNADQQLHNAQDRLVPLAERTLNAAVVEVTLAAWCRAFLSLGSAHILRSIALTQRWNSMKPIQWNGGSAKTDGTRIHSEVLQSLRESTRRLATQTAWLLEEPKVDSVYVDFTVMLHDFDANAHFTNYQNCLGAVIFTYEKFVQTYAKCLVEQDGSTDCAGGPVEPIVALCQMCGPLAPPHLKAYLQRTAALQLRSFSMLDPSELASIMIENTDSTNQEVHRMLTTLLTGFSSLKSESSIIAPWMGLLYAWLVTPVLLLTYRSARQLHNALRSIFLKPAQGKCPPTATLSAPRRKATARAELLSLSHLSRDHSSIKKKIPFLRLHNHKDTEKGRPNRPQTQASYALHEAAITHRNKKKTRMCLSLLSHTERDGASDLSSENCLYMTHGMP